MQKSGQPLARAETAHARLLWTGCPCSSAGGSLVRSACVCAVVAAWISACASNDAIHQLPESADARPRGGPGAVPAPAGAPPAAPHSCAGLDLPAPPMCGYSFRNETVRATGAAMDGRGVLALLSERDATPENKNIDFTATDGTWLGYDIG